MINGLTIDFCLDILIGRRFADVTKWDPETRIITCDYALMNETIPHPVWYPTTSPTNTWRDQVFAQEIASPISQSVDCRIRNGKQHAWYLLMQDLHYSNFWYTVSNPIFAARVLVLTVALMAPHSDVPADRPWTCKYWTALWISHWDVVSWILFSNFFLIDSTSQIIYVLSGLRLKIYPRFVLQPRTF